MKRALVVALIAVGLGVILFASGKFICAQEGEKITLPGGSFGQVAMPHKAHGDATCKECHHAGEDPVKKCSECHNADASMDSKTAFHKNCIECHKAKEKGPTGCMDCHKKS